jgi:hypothetical protein
MTEGTTTAALVVGIDRYDIGPTGLRPLTGAVADALAAVAWLQALDVPNDRIFLHASPDQAAAAATSVRVRPARELDIWGSAHRLGRLSGSRLFVFLFGHAVFEPRWGRLFFTQEFGVDDNWANLSINRYVPYFLSTDFRRQFLFVDGCNNLPYPEDARGRFQAGFRGGDDVTPRAENSLVACFSCSQAEFAAEIGGRGLFTRHLLKALAPDSPAPDALQLDWTTGEISVDITKAMAYLQPLVADEAATADVAQLQHPDYRLEGWPAPDRPTVMRIVGQPVGLDVQVDPAADVPAAVQQVEVKVNSAPYWTRTWEPGGASAAPAAAKLPKGVATRVVCWVRDGWLSEPQHVLLTLDADHTLQFRVGQDLGFGPSAGWVTPVPGTVEIQRLVAQQRGVGGWYATPYAEAAQAFGLLKPPFPGAWVAPGVTMFEHESGPEFHLDVSAQGQDAVIQDWKNALNHVTPPDVTYRVEVLRTTPAPLEPELWLDLPAGGAARLGGPLVEQPAVWVGPAGADQSKGSLRSLREVEREPAIKVRSGPVRVAVELPWGSWNTVIDVSEQGLTRVTLPDSVGLPPLRTILASELYWLRGYSLVIGTAGPRPAGWVQTGLFGASRRPLKLAADANPGPDGSAGWSLSVPDVEVNKPSPGMLVALESGERFPVQWSRAFGMETTPRGLRVEPLSAINAPEWDLLVATGRLDSLGPEDRRKLSERKWEDPIMGLAAAYAIHMAAERRQLKTVLLNTRTLFGPLGPCDLDLLEIAAAHPRGGRLNAGESHLLDDIAGQGLVPAFRWGIGLARDLAAQARPTPALKAWTVALREVAERLSPLSIWTAWQDRPDPGREPGTHNGQPGSDR